MKTKFLSIIAVAFIIISCCKKEDPIPPVPKPYEAFLLDPTPRIERGKTVEKNDVSDYVFYADKSANFFGADPKAKPYKIGYAKRDLTEVNSIEWAGNEEGFIRTNKNNYESQRLFLFKKLKEEKGLVWIVYQIEGDSPLIKMVQEF